MHEPKHDVSPEADVFPTPHTFDEEAYEPLEPVDLVAVVLAGEVSFASQETQLQRRAELLGAGALVVNVPPLPSAARGHLAEHVDERIERELAARGAPSPYLADWSPLPEDADARLSDQLFRARSVGTSGIAIAMGTLALAAHPALAPEDSATVQRLAHAAAGSPLVLMLDDADVHLGAYAAPVPLASLVSPFPPASSDAPLLELTAPAPPVARAEAGGQPTEEVEVEVEVEVELPDEAAFDHQALAQHVGGTDEHGAGADHEAEAHEPQAPGPEQTARANPATVGVPTARANDTWRAWALALGAARGPQPLAAFERLFVESYVPLASAIALGLDDPRAVRAHDEFQRGFERAYSDAFVTFGATNRRPRLVMDAHELASRQARLHNARAAHVLVVDSMRYDLGALIRDGIGQRAAGFASLTGESLLWSALPTTTIRQLETIARGIDALRAPEAEEPSESLRGRGADLVRRLRVGSRELYKLDVVPAMLASLGERGGRGTTEEVSAALEEIAETTADSIVRHLYTLSARTLLLVVGDHGFTVDRRGRITHGGATPEEVLVPAQAWLVGDLH
jgi:hypothetical protein